MNNAPIGVFDSGVGGISTLHACMDALKNESFVYLADRSGMPYGNKSHGEIASRVDACVETLLAEKVKAIVVACNTATNVGIKMLREKYRIPFVGVEPAVKPAVEACKHGNILVLLTVATAAQSKFQELVSRWDNGRLIIAPQHDLAEQVENRIDDISALRCEVHKILSRYRRVEGVVLGCTHYVFLRPLIDEFYGGRIKIFDSGVGAAKRLGFLIKENALETDSYRRSLKFLVI